LCSISTEETTAVFFIFVPSFHFFIITQFFILSSNIVLFYNCPINLSKQHSGAALTFSAGVGCISQQSPKVSAKEEKSNAIIAFRFLECGVMSMGKVAYSTNNTTSHPRRPESLGIAL
jgi:hypothetical protein